MDSARSVTSGFSDSCSECSGYFSLSKCSSCFGSGLSTPRTDSGADNKSGRSSKGAESKKSPVQRSKQSSRRSSKQSSRDGKSVLESIGEKKEDLSDEEEEGEAPTEEPPIHRLRSDWLPQDLLGKAHLNHIGNQFPVPGTSLRRDVNHRLSRLTAETVEDNLPKAGKVDPKEKYMLHQMIDKHYQARQYEQVGGVTDVGKMIDKREKILEEYVSRSNDLWRAPHINSKSGRGFKKAIMECDYKMVWRCARVPL